MPEYEDLAPLELDDGKGAGFYAFRRYPNGTELSRVVTADGRPAVRCYVAFIVFSGTTVQSVGVRAWFARRWNAQRVFSTNPNYYDPSPGDLDAPDPQSRAILARARKPIDLDTEDAGDSIYDSREDIFLNDQGTVVSPVQILDELYAKHCRTLALGFRIRWDIGSAGWWLIRTVVWKGQDVAMWALLKFYDVELVDVDQSKRRSPFHKYKPNDWPPLVIGRTTNAEDRRAPWR